MGTALLVILLVVIAALCIVAAVVPIGEHYGLPPEEHDGKVEL